MSQQENRLADSHHSGWREAGAVLDDRDAAALSAARARAVEEAGHSIARQLNGPLTALLLYMEELKQHSHRFLPAAGEPDHLLKVVENALLQTERVCALVKQVGGTHAVAKRSGWQGRPERSRDNGCAPLAAESSQRPLTKREPRSCI
jgi:hypothetical protein